MAGELVSLTQEMFAALDSSDADAIIRLSADEIQGVDEIARKWLRGLDELGGYIRELMGMVEGVHSTISNTHETFWGDTGAVTCWLEQDYVLNGAHQHISAPTTVLFRRDGDNWKITLFQSVPLPPEDA
ncbi:MAG TPA: nuclear transport factor 2 family protein [Candidatus Solibacter sp.]|jgi:ketosteroid isomerase-like protein|nr:nuclear transport factor 2 family protein [Candidatus Solibacter sp.]